MDPLILKVCIRFIGVWDGHLLRVASTHLNPKCLLLFSGFSCHLDHIEKISYSLLIIKQSPLNCPSWGLNLHKALKLNKRSAFSKLTGEHLKNPKYLYLLLFLCFIFSYNLKPPYTNPRGETQAWLRWNYLKVEQYVPHQIPWSQYLSNPHFIVSISRLCAYPQPSVFKQNQKSVAHIMLTNWGMLIGKINLSFIIVVR